MNQKASTLSLDWTGENRSVGSNRQLPIIAVGSFILIVAAVILYLFLIASGPDASQSTPVGLEADSARWTAMADHYNAAISRVERTTFANAARWSGLAGLDIAQALNANRATNADAARWHAQSEYYRARSEAAAAVDAERLTALAEWYAGFATFGE